MLEIRPMRPEDRDELRRLWTDVYVIRPLEQVDEYLREVIYPHVRLAVVDGVLAAVLMVEPFRIFWGHDEVAMGGIGGVATHAEHRRRGLVAALLKHAIEEMREREMPVSILYPFSYPFYRKYGWELAGLRRRSTVPMENLQPLMSTPGHARRLNPDNWEVMDRLYRWVGHQYFGPVLRDEERWKRRLQGVGKREHYAYAWYPEGSGEARAYVVYSFRSAPGESFPRSMFVHELVAVDGAAMRGILGFLGRHDAQARDVKLDMPFHWEPGLYIPDPSFPQELKPGFMVRVVDVEKALTRPTLRAQVTGKLVLRVQDELAPWNHGCFRLETGGDGLLATRTSSEHQVAMDIRTLAQVCSGFVTARQGAAAGLMEGAPKELAWLDAVFGQVRPHINDHF